MDVSHYLGNGHGVPVDLSAGGNPEEGGEDRIDKYDRFGSGKSLLELLFCRGL
jgi:hypothetical protein